MTTWNQTRARDLWGQIFDRADDPRLETAFWPGGLPVYNHTGHPALRASGLCRLLRVAAGPPRTLGGRLAPGDLGAGVSPRGPSELPAGPPGRTGLGRPADHLCECYSRCGHGANRAGS